MAQQQVAGQEEVLDAAMNKTEAFFQNNGRNVCYALVALLVLAGLIFGYRALISAPRVEKASAMIAEAQYRFEAENPDYELALLGDANGAGFQEVAESYGSTPAGNLACHYAGICYLKLGDLENAARYLAKFSPVKGLPGAVVNAQNLGLQGDIAVERADYASAVKFYEKAVAAAENNLTAPMYLRKAALAERAAGHAEKAEAYFRRIVTDYPASMDAREAEKYLGATK